VWHSKKSSDVAASYSGYELQLRILRGGKADDEVPGDEWRCVYCGAEAQYQSEGLEDGLYELRVRNSNRECTRHWVLVAE
jgi:hypothetical protein